jgi:hypothetical protein
MTIADVDVWEVDGQGKSCDGCTAEPETLFASGVACVTLLCADCLEECRQEGVR